MMTRTFVLTSEYLAIIPIAFGAFVPPGSDLNREIAFRTVAGFKLDQSISSAAWSEPASEIRTLVMKIRFFIFLNPTLQISDPAQLIFDCKPERHRRVHCIWLVRLSLCNNCAHV